jgi:hypothetical protein
LNRTPASAGNQKTWTYSDWIKRGALGTDQVILSAGQGAGTLYFYLRFLASDALDIFTYDSNTATFIWRLTTTQVFRDPSAWYHLVISTDTTQATAANRVKIYVNGTQVTAFTTASYPSLNYDTRFNANIAHYISSYIGSANFADCYQTEVNSIDGQALAPSSFGSTNALTGVWQPARYVGTYGTNGFYLPFTDNSGATATTIGKDFSGNSNNWTPNNISITAGVTYDSMTDVPTLTSATAANFAVLNPLNKSGGSTPIDGNLTCTGLNTTTNSVITATIAVSTGQWYFEFQASNIYTVFGITKVTNSLGVNPTNQVGAGNAYCYYGYNGNKYQGSTGSSYASTFGSGDIIGVAFDLTNGAIKFYKNGTDLGTAFTWTPDGSVFAPVIANDGTPNTGTVYANFGQRPFAYTPPTGYVALNTFNLPTSTIVKGNTVMDATIYSGDNASPRSITNAAGFKPDLVWVKSRTSTNWNKFTDSVRGATNAFYTNDTDDNDAAPLYGAISAFNSNGFSLASGSSGIADVNGSGNNYVAWQWQAGQGSNVTNTAGSITSTVSANPSAGFSIVSWTGNATQSATVGHGLGVKPKIIIYKNYSAVNPWPVISEDLLGLDGYLYLNTTAAKGTGASELRASTSSVLTLPTYGDINGSGNTMLAYCWTPIAGYSAFSSFVGNGSTDGPMVYTGFRPRFILFKAASNVADWGIYDTARNTYNVVNSQLDPNGSSAEYTSARDIDILSNGFKVRNSNGGMNTNGNTYIYAAFAENPFKNALAR